MNTSDWIMSICLCFLAFFFLWGVTEAVLNMGFFFYRIAAPYFFGSVPLE